MWTVLAAGFALGVRHAVEPDHLAAVATLVGDRATPLGGGWVGAAWGLGHTLALLVACGLLIAFDVTMPPPVAATLELAVAALLVALGLRALARAARPATGPAVAHQHGATAHAHPAVATHVHVGTRHFALRPLAVGLVHGLAGSGALTVMLIGGLPTPASRLVAVACFGLGSLVSMSALSALAGLSVVAFGGLSRGALAATGALSAGTGVVWGWSAIAG